MSANRQGHRSVMLGSNIRPGMTPGGMTSPLCKSRGPIRYSTRQPSADEIKDAANAVLEKRGFVQISEFERAAG